MAALDALSRSKVPEVTLAFWIIKIAATTLGETGGDALVAAAYFFTRMSRTLLFWSAFIVLCIYLLPQREARVVETR